MANFISKGFWNVVRRSRNQVLFFIPPLIAGYAAMEWAIERLVADAHGRASSRARSTTVCMLTRTGTST